MTTSESQEKRSDAMIERTLMTEAADLLLAVLASTNPAKIDPMSYWDHAQKALKVGATRGKDFGRMVSEMVDQIPAIEGALTGEAASKVYSIGQTMDARDNYQRFRQVCRKKAPYIVVLARHRKSEIDDLRSQEWIDSRKKDGR